MKDIVCQVQPLFVLSIQTFIPSSSCPITYLFFFFLTQHTLKLPAKIHGKSHLCHIVLFSQFVRMITTYSFCIFFFKILYGYI